MRALCELGDDRDVNILRDGNRHPIRFYWSVENFDSLVSHRGPVRDEFVLC
jgi:hypothetical protein